jgi:hypothetical protein
MEVNDDLYAPATLSPEKESPVSRNRETVPKSRRRENLFSLLGVEPRFLVYPAPS